MMNVGMVLHMKVKQLFYNAYNSFSLQAISTLLLFLSSIFYARILGATEYGIYLYCSSWVAVLCIPTGLGTREFFVRESAVIFSSENYTKLHQMINWGTSSVFKAYLLTVVIVSLVAWRMDIFKRGDFLFTYLAAIPFVLVMAQTGIRYAVLRGINKIVLAQAPESFFKPLIQVLLALFTWMVMGHLLSWQVMLIASISASAALLIIIRFTKKILIIPSTIVKPSKSQNNMWFRSTLPFMLISGLFLINKQINVIMLGSMITPKEAAIFKVASYGAEFLVFILMAANTSFAPTIAQLWKMKKKDELQKLITLCARSVVIITIPAAVMLFLMSEWLLSLFGQEFIQGVFAMRLLCVAQLFNVSIGSVGVILNMCNYERLTAWGAGLSSLINILANFYLIPHWGYNGAAASATISIVTWNLFLLIAVKKTTGLKPSVFGI